MGPTWLPISGGWGASSPLRGGGLFSLGSKFGVEDATEVYAHKIARSCHRCPHPRAGALHPARPPERAPSWRQRGATVAHSSRADNNFHQWVSPLVDAAS